MKTRKCQVHTNLAPSVKQNKKFAKVLKAHCGAENKASCEAIVLLYHQGALCKINCKLQGRTTNQRSQTLIIQN